MALLAMRAYTNIAKGKNFHVDCSIRVLLEAWKGRWLSWLMEGMENGNQAGIYTLWSMNFGTLGCLNIISVLASTHKYMYPAQS